MQYPNKWDIPTYGNYYIKIDPFKVINKSTRYSLKITPKKYGHPYVKLTKKGECIRISVVQLACRVFHGLPPIGYMGIFYGENYLNICPSNVMWVPKKVAIGHKHKVYTEHERYNMMCLYFNTEYTQKEIANLYRISESTVSRAINREYINRKS